MNYEKQAKKFLEDTGTTLGIVYIGHEISDNRKDGNFRDRYEFTLTKGNHHYSADFWQSIAGSEEGKEPTAYDILACLDVDYTEDFNDFCEMFGYNDLPLSEHDRVMNIYEAVKEQSEALQRLYTEEELEQLQEIQ